MNYRRVVPRDGTWERAPTDLRRRRRSAQVLESACHGANSPRRGLPRLLSDGESLSPGGRECRRPPVESTPVCQRVLRALFQREAQPDRSFVPGTLQGESDRTRHLFARSGSVRRIESMPERTRFPTRGMELEQFSTPTAARGRSGLSLHRGRAGDVRPARWQASSVRRVRFRWFVEPDDTVSSCRRNDLGLSFVSRKAGETGTGGIGTS